MMKPEQLLRIHEHAEHLQLEPFSQAANKLGDDIAALLKEYEALVSDAGPSGVAPPGHDVTSECEVCGHTLDAQGLNHWGNPNCAGGRPHRIAK